MANIEPYRKILEDNHLDVNNVSAPQDISLELEYPALATQINAALAQGWDKDKLRKLIAERETMALTQYSPAEINQFLGHNEQNIKHFWEETHAQNEQSYANIIKYDMSREKVRDILYLAENTGIAPGPLLLNPDLVPIAKEIAGPELGLGDAAKNMVANYEQGASQRNAFTAAGIRQDINLDDENLFYSEGLRVLNENHMNTGLQLDKQEIIELGKKSLESRAAYAEYNAQSQAQTAQDWYVKGLPPRKGAKRFFVNLIQNFGFTGAAMLRSMLGWYFGGPAGMLGASLYNTMDEAQTEAGEAFAEALRRGKSPEEAYKIGQNVRLGNLRYLPASNYGADYVFYRGTEFIGKTTDKWIPDSKIPVIGWAAKLARMGLRNIVLFVLDSQTEGWEEYFQEYFKKKLLVTFMIAICSLTLSAWACLTRLLTLSLGLCLI